MKYVIIIPDGCADWAVESLGNRTPLQAANLPNIQALAQSGIVGQSCNVPEGLAPGSDVAVLGLLGYNAALYYTGRAPLEAVAQGIELADTDWAIRCNLVTIADAAMQSFSAGHISTSEAAEIMQTLNEQLAPKSPIPLQFYPGVSYRNLAILRDCQSQSQLPPPFDQSTKTHPPHDYSGNPITDALPTGTGSGLLRFWMNESQKILTNHPVNQRRIEDGKPPATQIWLWGHGQKPNLPLFGESIDGRRTKAPVSIGNTGEQRAMTGNMTGNVNYKGAMITAVDLLRGIATLIGWDIIEVPGITGYLDTDFAAKGRYAAEALKEYDIVCVHIEAPDEAGHEGCADKKVWALEEIDAKVIPPIIDALRSYGDWRLFLSPDHPTPCTLRTHTAEAVPWLLAGSGIPALSQSYDEETAKNSAYQYEHGWEAIERVFR